MIINGFGGDKPNNPNGDLGWVALLSLTATNVVPTAASGNYPLVPETATAFKFDFRPYKAVKIQLSNFSMGGTCTNATTSTSKYMQMGVGWRQRQTSTFSSHVLWYREYIAQAANVALSSCKYEEQYFTAYPLCTEARKSYNDSTFVYDFVDAGRRIDFPSTDNTSLAYDFHLAIIKTDSNPMAISNWKISGTWTLMGLPW